MAQSNNDPLAGHLSHGPPMAAILPDPNSPLQADLQTMAQLVREAPGSGWFLS